MNRRALTALQDSIEKWRQIVDGTMADVGGTNCMLCATFNDGGDCFGCPVHYATGLHGCGGTPYDAWCEEAQLTQRDEDEIFGWCEVADTPEKRRLAKLELKFLTSLLPEGAC